MINRSMFQRGLSGGANEDMQVAFAQNNRQTPDAGSMPTGTPEDHNMTFAKNKDPGESPNQGNEPKLASLDDSV